MLESFLWTMTPMVFKWTTGESNPDFLVASQASSHWTSSPVEIARQSDGKKEKT